MIRLAAALLLSAASAAEPRLKLVRVAGGLQEPVALETAPGGAGRLYVALQRGKVVVVDGGKVAPEPFVDVSARTRKDHPEQGLLGLAFDPGFAKNRRFFLHYTDLNGDTVVSAWTAASLDRADPASERVILAQKQPFANHNGGQLAFGPDRMLYLGLGDGGSGGDPSGNGQNLGTLLGKILRLDISTAPYAIPANNPFRSAKDARPEIWAYGLRNPWRFSFDGPMLWIADVGQDQWEEVDVEDLRAGGGKNYGWNRFEGFAPFKKGAPIRHYAPVAVYGHDHGNCSITGGYVYRGKRIPWLKGRYVHGDYCSGRIWALQLRDGKAWVQELTGRIERPKGLMISSFGRDAAGELYVLDYAAGAVLRLETAR